VHWMNGWDWAWMTFMMVFWVVLLAPWSTSPSASRSARRALRSDLRRDLAERSRAFGGYDFPVRIIAPAVELHSLLRVDPGLVRMDIDYGYMRAFDEMQPDDAKRAHLRQLSCEIFTRRKEVWGPLEHSSEGQLMDEWKASFGAERMQLAPDAFALADVRRVKIEIRVLADERQTLAKAANANPPGFERTWQQWEQHKWSPTLVTPWEASSAHVGPPLNQITPPGALPPPPP
jgi:hypothetical protein